MLTRVVSLSNPIKLPTIFGIINFNACGITISTVACQYVRPTASAASYWPFGIACRPPRTTSAIYAAANKHTATIALASLLITIPPGRNSGNIVVAINNMVIKGTDRKSSINATHRTLITAILDRRPRARSIPAGRADAIAIPDMTRVRNRPPQRLLDIYLKVIPLIRKPTTTTEIRVKAITGYLCWRSFFLENPETFTIHM